MIYAKWTSDGPEKGLKRGIVWLVALIFPGPFGMKELNVVTDLLELDDEGVVRRTVGLDNGGRPLTAWSIDGRHQGPYTGETFPVDVRELNPPAQLIERNEFEEAWATVMSDFG